MKIFQCDICGCHVKQNELYDLNDDFKFDNYNQVCNECLVKIEDLNCRIGHVIRNVKCNWIKQFIISLKFNKKRR